MELGFVEKVDDPSVLSSSFFPSKVGGKPAWLNLQDLPRPQSVSCKKCRFPLLFLLQVYAPLSDGENDCTFHRSIFLFMCKDPNCHQDDSSKCFRVLRCQLPKVNIFYSLPVSPVLDTSEQLDKLDQEEIEPPSQNDKLISGMTVKDIEGVDDEVKMKPVVSTDAETMSVVCTEVSSLCVVCGMSGPMSCAKCKRVNYCSREHQVYDWRNGHKLFCPELAKGLECVIDYIPSVGAVLPLFEIVTEPEPLPSEVPEEKTIEQRMADYHKIVKTKNLHISEVKHDDFVGEKKSDKQFKAFKKRVALEPEQVSFLSSYFCSL